MKQDLKELWAEGQSLEAYFYWLEIQLPDTPTTEMIANPSVNVEAKLAYIDKTYDENLVSVHNPEVKIVNFGYCNDLNAFLQEQEQVTADDES